VGRLIPRAFSLDAQNDVTKGNEESFLSEDTELEVDKKFLRIRHSAPHKRPPFVTFCEINIIMEQAHESPDLRTFVEMQLQGFKKLFKDLELLRLTELQVKKK
jgi:hypothetical protein